MRRIVTLTAFVVMLALTSTMGSIAATAQSPTPVPDTVMGDLQAATDWIVSQQSEDGSFAGFDGEPDPSITIDAIIALVAAQLQGLDTGSSIDDAITWLEAGDVTLVYAQTGVGQSAKLALGILVQGGDPSNLASVNPIMLVEFGLNDETGMYGQGVYDHALAILALSAAGSSVPSEALDALAATQTPDGGWAFDGTTDAGAADSNTTSVVIQALVAAGEGESHLVADGLDYLRTTLVDQSGATFQPGNDAVADANSTALVLQAMIAAGLDPADASWGNMPRALAAFQNDSGAFRYNDEDPSDNLFATVQALPALAGYSLPVTEAQSMKNQPSARTWTRLALAELAA